MKANCPTVPVSSYNTLCGYNENFTSSLLITVAVLKLLQMDLHPSLMTLMRDGHNCENYMQLGMCHPVSAQQGTHPLIGCGMVDRATDNKVLNKKTKTKQEQKILNTYIK